MRPRTVAETAPGLLLAAAVLLGGACSSRPIANRDGGDASRDTSGGGGSGIAGATGAAGEGGAVAGRGGDGGAMGGRGGEGARGGAGGATGDGGRGGTSGATGGRGGAGGTSVSGPECATASDCKLVDNCCTCQAIPNSVTAPACVEVVCKQNQCSARQLGSATVDCVAGRCVAGFACDTTKVICKVATPSCPAGEVPTVNESGTCYTGACAPASECTSVASCEACTPPNSGCVDYATQMGTQHHCVTFPSGCSTVDCACLGAGSCVAPYRACANYSGIRGISCSCPNC
ncbi:MAG TPA: hypothetical protein VN903_36110 [Polyangia bacterium]|jgi:hypothetical protein|nr:hypothetical protein [Polyangia bacterium]